MNVMLSRARKGMIIIAKRLFIQNHPETLVARLAEKLGTGWLQCRELENGVKIFSDEVRLRSGCDFQQLGSAHNTVGPFGSRTRK